MSKFTKHISVTQSHIDHGTANDCYLCPVAIAIGWELDPFYCEVGHTAILLIYDDHKYTIPMPARVAQFITEFDSGVGVSPIEFDLEFNEV